MADLFSNLPGNMSTGTMDIFQPGLYPSSYSGMNQNFSNTQLNNITPLLTAALGNLPNSGAQFMNTNAGGALQTMMNNLASRGMVNSSVASDALAKTATGLGSTAMQMQYSLPTMLGQLASNMGNYSYSSNPLAPYEMLSNFVLNY